MPVFETVGLDPHFVDYETGWNLQRQIHSEVVSGVRPDTVLLLEHSPVYTAGKRTDVSELPFDGSSYVETDRGGKITWHGPGQLVGYPIMKLPQPIDVVGFVRFVEQSLIDSLAEMGVQSTRVAGRTGVWIERSGEFEKVAAIGIRVAEKTTMHGFAINCSNSLRPFENIVACGLAEVKATSLSATLEREVTPAEFAEVVKRHLGEIPNGRTKA